VSQLRDQYEVLPTAEDLVHGGELAGQAEGLPHVSGLRGDVEPVDVGRPRIRLEQSGKDPHDGGLAGAIRAEQGEDATPLHLEVDAAQDVDVLVRLLQALYLDRRLLDLNGGHLVVRSLSRLVGW